MFIFRGAYFWGKNKAEKYMKYIRILYGVLQYL